MFCTSCGQKISDKADFCTECGASIKNNKIPHTEHHNKKTRGDLEQRAWYRFLKVIYLLFFISAILATIGISWAEKPRRTIDGNLSSIACDNGKYYAPAKNSIWVIGDTLDYTDDKHARILCKYDTLDFYNYRYSNEFIAKNYVFKPIYEKTDYVSWIAYSLLAIVIVWLVLRIIKLAFFYIAIGHKPKIEDFKKII
jgi:hypothetical protein